MTRSSLKRVLSLILTIPFLITFLSCALCLPAAASDTNLVLNGDFEHGLDNWSKTNSNYDITFPSGSGRTGNFAARFAIDDASDVGDPFLCQRVTFVPNTEYEFSVWVKITGGTAGSIRAVMPVTYNRRNADGSSSEVKFVGKEVGVNEWQAVDSQWHRITNTFTTANDMTSGLLYVRVYGSAIGTEVYFDDASLVMVSDPLVATMDTDQWIYYSDRTADGTATVEVSSYYEDIYSGGKVDFVLKDGSTALRTVSNTVVTDGVATFTYPMSLLTEKKHEYTVEATVKESDGTVKDTLTRRIFKYDRPAYLNADGQMTKGGKRIYPLWGASSHINSYWEPVIVEGGINVMPGGAYNTAAAALEALNLAQEKGAYLLLYMYHGLNVPAHPDNVDRTCEIVNAVKNHPALFAYSMIDEPSVRNDITDDDLIDSYTLIRDIDPNHPVYITENIDFAWAGKGCDILGVDPYGRPETKTVTKNVARAVTAVNDDKPVMAMVQAFKSGNYYPEPNEFRLSLYQGLLAGAKGLAFYKFSKGAEDGVNHLNTSDLWPVLVDFEFREKELMYDHFVFGDTEVFNRSFSTTQDVCYHSFEKDDDIYMIITNSTTSSKQVSIPLTKGDGSETIKGFTAIVFSGADPQTINSLGTTLDVTLAANTAVVYKITPYGKQENIGFEPGDSGWVLPSGAALVTEDSKVGTASLKITNSGADSIAASKATVVSTDKKHEVSAYFNLTQLSDEADGAKLSVINTSGQEIAATSYFEMTGKGWRKMMVILPSGLKDEVVNINLELRGAGTVYFDEVSIKESQELCVNGDLSGMISDLTPAGYTRFEKGSLNQWESTVENAAAVNGKFEIATEGNNSYAKLTGNYSRFAFEWKPSENAEMERGARYKLAFDYKGDSMSIQHSNHALYEVKESGGYNTAYQTQLGLLPTVTEWTHYEYYFTYDYADAKANAMYFIALGARYADASTKTCYVDNISLEKVEDDKLEIVNNGTSVTANYTGFDKSTSIDWSKAPFEYDVEAEIHKCTSNTQEITQTKDRRVTLLFALYEKVGNALKLSELETESGQPVYQALPLNTQQVQLLPVNEKPVKLSKTISIPINNKSYVVKAFAWDDITSMLPQLDSDVFEIE